MFESHLQPGGQSAFVSSPDRLRYMFIDFNAYFASVEQHDEPALRGHPVIVTPLASEHSGAIAASYEAKALGILRGTSVADARRICPEVAVRPARHDRYVTVHHHLMREIERHLPVLRVHSIDECVCRLGSGEDDIAAATAKALEVKRGIIDNVGSALRASIGLAPSILLAKLASDLQKPDGLVALPASCLPGALEKLPLRAISGIGEGVARRLARAGIDDFRALWALEPRHARAIWGSVEGERLLYALKGYDVPAQPVAAKRMIGHSRVLAGSDRHPAAARIVARALMLKAASRLRRHGLYAGGMHVAMRIHPEGALAHEAVFRPTRNSSRLLRELDGFWAAMIAARAGGKGGGAYMPRLALVTVYLFNLQAGPPERDMFVAEEDDARDARQAALWERIDRINARYGAAKVMLASQQSLNLDYLGTKIAFSRIPDLAEFADMPTSPAR